MKLKMRYSGEAFRIAAVRLSPLFSLTGDEGSAANEGAVSPIRFAEAVDRQL